jgi:hypothetical protein
MISVRPPSAACGESAADSLAHRGEVGGDTVVRLRPAVRRRKRDHLVEDEHDAMTLCHLSQSLQELGGGGDHAGRTHDRLDDDRRHARRLALEHLLGTVGVVERKLEHVLRHAGSHARRHAAGREADRRVAHHEHVGDAVVAALGLRQLRASGVRAPGATRGGSSRSRRSGSERARRTACAR